MQKYNRLQHLILTVLLRGDSIQSSQIHAALQEQGETASLVTIKRALSALVKVGSIRSHGGGRSTAYTLTVVGKLMIPIDASLYCKTEPDKRYGQKEYNFDLLGSLPTELFLREELSTLNGATANFQNRKKEVSPTIAQKELERLVIELSWKSSKIEGNTYTLLDTEKLIREQCEAPGHDHAEAQMILNHKDAFTFIYQHADQFKNMKRATVEHVHNILLKDLGVGAGLRSSPVGIVGSLYKPLDNKHQITDAFQKLETGVHTLESAYSKSLMTLLGISYIQPFEDGNKRTARLMANAILLGHHCAPLSYRSVDENAFREATLVFYELNSIIPLKDIFIDQYIFAAENYSIA